MVDRSSSDIHAWVEERLSAFIDNQLAQDERVRVTSHLGDCARCRASLESLQWTLSLVKQAPAPALPRSFTLPVTREESQAGGLSFAFLRAATAIATLLLCLVIGLDLFSQTRFGVAQAPSAPLPAAQFAAPTQNVALAPAATSAPTSASAAAGVPTLASQAAPPIAPTSAPAATQPPPQGLSQPVALPSPTRALSAGAAEVQATRPQADSALKSLATVPAAPPAPRSAITATVALPSPAPTQPVPTQTIRSATNTPAFEARTQPTREILPSSAGIEREGLPIVRMLELGLLGLVGILGIAALIVWRRK